MEHEKKNSDRYGCFHLSFIPKKSRSLAYIELSRSQGWGVYFWKISGGCLISEFYCKPQEPQTCTQFYYTTTHYGEDILAATPANGGRNEPAFYGPFPY